MAVGALTKSCAKMLDCTGNPDGTSTLDTLPDMLCWEGNHLVYAGLGAAGPGCRRWLRCHAEVLWRRDVPPLGQGDAHIRDEVELRVGDVEAEQRRGLLRGDVGERERSCPVRRVEEADAFQRLASAVTGRAVNDQ